MRDNALVRRMLFILLLFSCGGVKATVLERQFDFVLKPQSLIDALKKVAKTAQIELMLPHHELVLIDAKAVEGEMSLAMVLDRLLKDTALEYVLIGQKMLVIRQRVQRKIKKSQGTKVKPQFEPDPGLLQRPLEHIEVSGYRGAMARSLIAKYEHKAVSEVIEGQEIGKFPDSNVAEAMQRLSGVTLDRGEYISIRGADPQMTRVEVNGRTIATTSAANRDVSFMIFGSELFQTIEVIKTTSADMDEGGIGGVVSLQTPRPLDIAQRHLGFEFGFNRTSAGGANRSEYSLFTNQLFAEGRAGVFVSLARQQERSSISNSEVKGWQHRALQTPNGTEPLDVLTGLKLRLNTIEQQRINQYLALQWQAGEQWMWFADYLYSSRKPVDREDSFESAGSTTFIAPYMANINNFGVADEVFYQDLATFQTTRVDDIQYFQKGGRLALQWSPRQWLLQTDLFHTHSGREQQMMLARTSADVDLGYRFDYQGKMPLFFAVSPSGRQFVKAQHQLAETSDKETALSVDVEHPLNSEYFSQIGFGFKLKKRTKLRHGLEKEVWQAPLWQEALQPFPVSAFAPEAMDDGLDQWISLDTDSIVGDNLTAMSFAADPGKFRDQQERSSAGFFMVDIDTGIGDIPLSGNIGVRWVDYQSQSKGYTLNIDGCGESWFQLAEVEHGFDRWLPSGNFVLSPTDDRLIRLSMGKVLAYSNFGLLQPDVLVDRQKNQMDIANPQLQPNQSWQFDLSYEHYFADEGLFSAAVFYKRIDSYNEKLVSDEQLLIDGELESYQVSRRVNGHGARLKGIELNLQTPFSFLPGFWQHFGVFANVTVSHSSRQLSNGARIKLPGQADLASNVVLYWEREGLSMRLGYNYRDKALSTRSGESGLLLYEAPRQYIDFAVRYQFAERWRFSLEGMNIGKQPIYQYQEDVLHPISYSLSQSRYYLGLGYRY